MARSILRYILLVLCASIATQAAAQFEGTKAGDRLGKDASANYAYYTQFNKFLIQTKNFTTDVANWPCDSLYECWRRLYDGAPFFTVNTYIHGAAMLSAMAINAKKSDAERMIYFQDLMQIYEDRIRRNDSLNSTITNEKARSKRSAVMVMRAARYQWTVPQLSFMHYDTLQAYRNFVDAFAAVRAEQNSSTDEISANDLARYFNACQDLYKSNPELYTEQFLTDYINCLESCDKMMTAYEGNDSLHAKWEEYADMHTRLQGSFKLSDASKVENLESFYKSRLDSIKGDYNALKRAVHLMQGTNNDTLLHSYTYYNACQYSYNIQPDFENCIGLASRALYEFEDKAMSRSFYDKADSLASTPVEHYQALANAALSLATEKEPKEPNEKFPKYLEYKTPWRAHQSAAAEKFAKAIAYGQEAGVPSQYLAKLYDWMAKAYAKSVDERNIAKAEEIVAKIPQIYSAYQYLKDCRNIISKNKDLVQQEKDYWIRNEKNKKAKEAYDAYIAKLKAEEDFWAGKK